MEEFIIYFLNMIEIQLGDEGRLNHWTFTPHEEVIKNLATRVHRMRPYNGIVYLSYQNVGLKDPTIQLVITVPTPTTMSFFLNGTLNPLSQGDRRVESIPVENRVILTFNVGRFGMPQRILYMGAQNNYLSESENSQTANFSIMSTSLRFPADFDQEVLIEQTYIQIRSLEGLPRYKYSE
jgi:hypothetical protein